MADKVKTLGQSLKEAKQLANMYKDLIRNGKTREAEIESEIEQLQETLGFLQRSRAAAPDSLRRAMEVVHRLELKVRANQSAGYLGPSAATLQKKANRVESLSDKVRALAAELRSRGLDPLELLGISDASEKE